MPQDNRGYHAANVLGEQRYPPNNVTTSERRLLLHRPPTPLARRVPLSVTTPSQEDPPLRRTFSISERRSPHPNTSPHKCTQLSITSSSDKSSLLSFIRISEPAKITILSHKPFQSIVSTLRPRLNDIIEYLATHPTNIKTYSVNTRLASILPFMISLIDYLEWLGPVQLGWMDRENRRVLTARLKDVWQRRRNMVRFEDDLYGGKVAAWVLDLTMQCMIRCTEVNGGPVHW